jgi:uncharacterized protein (TIGR02001 family)
MKRWLAVAAAAGLMASGSLSARAADGETDDKDDAKTSVSAGVDFLSGYIWRGMTLNDSFVVQPSMEVAFPAGISALVWANFDVGDYGGALEGSEFSEVDLALTYTLPVKAVDLSIGYAQYLYPQAPGDDESDTAELCVYCEREVAEGVAVGVNAFYDVDQVDDFYVAACVTCGCDLPVDDLSVEVSAHAGYAGGNYCADGDPGFYDYAVGLVLAYEINDGLTAAVTGVYVGSLDPDKLTSEDRTVDGYYGANLSVSF